MIGSGSKDNKGGETGNRLAVPKNEREGKLRRTDESDDARQLFYRKESNNIIGNEAEGNISIYWGRAWDRKRNKKAVD